MCEGVPLHVPSVVHINIWLYLSPIHWSYSFAVWVLSALRVKMERHRSLDLICQDIHSWDAWLFLASHRVVYADGLAVSPAMSFREYFTKCCDAIGRKQDACAGYALHRISLPRPSSYPPFGPQYPLLGTIYPQLRVRGRSWLLDLRVLAVSLP